MATTSRRRLAPWVVAGLLGIGAYTSALLQAQPTPDVDELRGDEPGHASHFGRMFHLPAFAPPTPAIRAALERMGRRGSRLDARDPLAAGPIALIVDPLLSLNNPNNDGHTAGLTFLGQFLDHDMTFDTSSRLGRPTNPRRTPNARRPFLDLDSVYGAGPSGSPHLYDPADRAKLRVETGGLYEDLPRDAEGHAIIADPRNDENIVIAGLHAAMLLAHNRVVDAVRQQTPEITGEDAFAEARRLLTWHYQWIVVHELLPALAGRTLVDHLLREGPTYYHPAHDDAFIPVEFQMAYRIGHSMVRPSYRANFTGNGGQPFFGFIFDPTQAGAADPEDLRGGLRSARRFVGWSTFFRFPGLEGDTRPNKRIDTRLSTPLFDLPLAAIASGMPPSSLAERNLLRHLTWSLPSGQAIARAIGVTPVTDAALADLAEFHPRFVRSTPLWYYVLKEAEVLEQGLRLGPVGGRLVAEVFVGLLQSDSDSYLNADAPFSPTLGAEAGHFAMADLLTFAGVGGRR